MMAKRWRVGFTLVACVACKPTEAQQADVRARFEAADKADDEPDRTFRALAIAMRKATLDASAEPCPIEWAPADRSLLVQGVSRWAADIEITKHPPPHGTLLLQADNVTIADHDASFDAIGTASRQRRRGLEVELLERKGKQGDLDGKAFMASAASILSAPLPKEILIDLLYAANPTLQDEETFAGGFSVAHVYLYDHASSRFVCAGSFTAESSDVVRTGGVLGGQFWLNTNFYVNLVDAAKKSLRALAPTK